MAAFPSFQHHHHPFLLDSVFSALPNTPSTINSKVCGFLEVPNNATSYFPQFSADSVLNQNLDHSTNIPAPSNNEGSGQSGAAANRSSMDNSSSIITADNNNNNNRRDQTSKKPQKVSPMDKKRKSKQATNSSNSAQSKDMREGRGKKQKKMKDGEEKEEEKKEEKKEAPTGYIHVRARRGQATDSHSLAERVRRERISERMKLLQALVPGCDKVTGKALMLDEIINYVQSLQNQVEFLSMKLASVNPMFYDFGMDLESIMIRPDQDLSSLPPPLQSMQQTPTTANNYPPMDNSANTILFQQLEIPNDSSQGNRQTLWGVDEQRPKIFNQSGFNNNCLFSFH